MNTHDRWQRIKEIFISAQGRPPAERSDYLNEVCRDDPSVRQEVEALLTADADNDGKVSQIEYVAAMKGKLDETAAKAKFAELDKNKDGTLSREEFNAGVEKKGGKNKKDGN